jgi:hypothetical protein
MQNGSLVTFAPDLETVLQRAVEPSSAPAVQFEIDRSDARVVMLDLHRGPLEETSLGQAPPPTVVAPRAAVVQARKKAPPVAKRAKSGALSKASGTSKGTAVRRNQSERDCPAAAGSAR